MKIVEMGVNIFIHFSIFIFIISSLSVSLIGVYYYMSYFDL
jgi:hypothetical protein